MKLSIFIYKYTTMPLMKCTENGVSGWKYGPKGKCYKGPDAKKKAVKQGLAEHGGKWVADEAKASKQDYEDVDVEKIIREFGSKAEDYLLQLEAGLRECKECNNGNKT